MLSRLMALAALILLSPRVFGAQQVTPTRFPGKHWQKYAKPEEAGFSAEKLAVAKAYFDSTDAAALIVVYKGAVVADWGQTARRYMCHSARKSLMSGMYGIYIDNGVIDTSLTLAQLGIDESPTPLTDAEKKARIADLLAARSGIYLLAAYEPAENPKPPRGKFAPGTNWCYNNWDFNTLLTIFEQQTKTKFFDEFEKRFAKPLGMQDYHPYDGYYHFEREKSMHAAYPFRMSARDLARFGLLYLNHGRWQGKQILSEKYVSHSTSRISEGTWTGAYGFLWWLYDAEPFKSLGMFSALGLGDQAVHVIPKADMVFVIRTDTYAGKRVDQGQHLKLVKMFLDAMTGAGSKNARVVDIPDSEPAVKAIPVTAQEMTPYVKDYPIDHTGWTVRVVKNGNLMMIDEGDGAFPLDKVGPDHFVIRDKFQDVYFTPDSTGSGKQMDFMDGILTVASQYASEGKEEDAFKVLKDGEKYFPNDATLHQFWGDLFVGVGQPKMDSAIIKYARLHQLDSTKRLDYTGLGWWLPQVYSQVFPPDNSESQLRRFVGKYGPRTVVLDSGHLFVSREGRPGRTKIKRLTETIFAIDAANDVFHLMFHIDENGQVDKAIGMYVDGRRDENVKER